MLQRRKFLIGLAAGIVAPAIIPYKSLMPVKAIIPPLKPHLIAFTIKGWDQYGNTVTLQIPFDPNPTALDIVRSTGSLRYIHSITPEPYYST